jgi:hypothetical protein
MMQVLVDRFIYQGLRYAASRHAVRDQPVSGHTRHQDEKGSLLARWMEAKPV